METNKEIKGMGKFKDECIYCGKNSENLRLHMATKHKNAIRCANWGCVTYFHTEEERKKHNEEVHLQSKERRRIACKYCNKELQSINRYRYHVTKDHVDLPVRCLFYGCLFYFQSPLEMKVHLDNDHKKDLEMRIHKCKECDYRAKRKYRLVNHIQVSHPAKYSTSFDCDSCKRGYLSAAALKSHNYNVHKLRKCKYCQLSVPHVNKHVQKKNCQRCQNQFDCSGLFQNHKNKCKGIQLKCVICQKVFQIKSLLDLHMKGECGKIRPSKPQPRNNANARFECDICKKMLLTKVALAEHITNNHLVIECKHCKQSVRLIYLHLEQKKCSRCEKSFGCHRLLKIHSKICR